MRNEAGEFTDALSVARAALQKIVRMGDYPYQPNEFAKVALAALKTKEEK